MLTRLQTLFEWSMEGPWLHLQDLQVGLYAFSVISTNLYEVVQVTELAHIGDSLLLCNILKDFTKGLCGIWNWWRVAWLLVQSHTFLLHKLHYAQILHLYGKGKILLLDNEIKFAAIHLQIVTYSLSGLIPTVWDTLLFNKCYHLLNNNHIKLEQQTQLG